MATLNQHSVVLIYDIDCFIAITHKYQLNVIGLYKDSNGNFASGIKNNPQLKQALSDYNEAEVFTVPLAGFLEHREACLEEFDYLTDGFGDSIEVPITENAEGQE